MWESGYWKGSYCDPRHPDSEFAITAYIQVERNELTGEMRDLVTTLQTSVATELGFLTKECEAYAAFLVFAAEYPNAVCITSIPEKSILAGRVDGSEVTFTKTYVGEAVSCWATEGRLLSVENHEMTSLEYVGTMNPEGTEISGTWKAILPPSEGPIPEWFSGKFVLRRCEE